MSGVFKYSRINSDAALPTSNNDAGPSSTRTGTPAFGRARTRWLALIGLASVGLLLFLTVSNAKAQTGSTFQEKLGNLGDKLRNGFATGSRKNDYSGIGHHAASGATDAWVQGSGKQNLNYSTPFNGDDLTLTEDECDAAFPGLWAEIDRSVEYYTKHP